MDNLNFPLSFTREPCVWEGRNIFECNVQLHLDLRKLKMNLSFLNSKWIFEQFSTVTLISLHFNFLFSIPSIYSSNTCSICQPCPWIPDVPAKCLSAQKAPCLPGVSHVWKALKESAGQRDCCCGWETSGWTGETRSRDNSQKQKSTGASASRALGHSAPSFPLSCSPAGSSRSSRPLEQIDNVGQNDQAYDSKEHQDENIQHCGFLGRPGPWILVKRELWARRLQSVERNGSSSLHGPALVLSPPPPGGLRLKDAAAPPAASCPPTNHSQPITKPGGG